jgi:PAS domain S-box-containing protein
MRRVEVNEMHSQLTGYSREEVLGKTFEELQLFVNPEDYEISTQILLQHRVVRDFETKLRIKSGEIRFVNFAADIIELQGNKYALITFEDITDLKTAEQELRKKEEQQALILRSLPMAFYVAQPFGNFGGTWVSEQMENISGIAPDQFMADINLWAARLHPDDKKHALMAFEKIHQQGSVSVEYRWKVADGYYKWFHDEAVLVRDENGASKEIIGTWLDVTERKQAEKAIENALIEVEKLKNRLQVENIYLQDEIKIEHNFEEIISQNQEVRKVLRKVEQVALTSSTVLILGETGTGKELFARAVHNLSDRSDRPLVKVDCTALPANLIESELFGHERGAFTGAFTRKIGRFEVADGGTIFLDEIGELPLALQVKLLRFLQEGKFERLGGLHTIKVDVRVIAATNRDLEGAITAGDFRQDLYYRLNVFPVNIPPLRNRKDDIPLLVNHFAKKFVTKLGKEIKSIPLDVMGSLQAYHWPGNIRELENIIERAIILTKGSVLKVDELINHSPPLAEYESLTLKENEKAFLVNALEKTNWVIEGKSGAAQYLDIPPSTLRARIKKHGVSRPSAPS